MRVLQNSAFYASYLPRVGALTAGVDAFDAMRDAVLADRFGACHFLQPVLDRNPQAFFTSGDYAPLQRAWAREQGMPDDTTLDAILLAQIEHHGAEVFYNLDPMRYGHAFLSRLPSCVKHSIAWRAAPSPGADFAAYDCIVCNFPSILQSYREQGWKAEYFAPAHDPEMDVYAANPDRPVDVVFVGGYSRHHTRRAAVLEDVARLSSRHKIVFHLDRSRLTRLAESPFGRLLPLRTHRRPAEIRRISADPIFGRDVYGSLSQAKIVLNGAVDMAGDDRGNMRCFEAMGCGATLLSDEGRYPQGMASGSTMLTYRDAAEATSLIEQLLADPPRLGALARAGNAMVRSVYSKTRQWHDFQRLVASL